MHSLGIPVYKYDSILDASGLGEEHEEQLVDLFKRYERIVFFGDGVSAIYFSQFLGKSLCACQTSSTLIHGFNTECDLIFVAVSPRHYDGLQDKINKLSSMLNCDAVFPFEFFNPHISCIFETQPRSGTGFIIKSLRRHCGFKFGTIFENELATFTGAAVQSNQLFFDVSGIDDKYVVKTHFFQRARDVSYVSKVKYMRLYGYPFDSYYLWAKDIFVKSGDDDYKLCSDSPEWMELRKMLYENMAWMMEDVEGEYILYEDFHRDYGASCDKIRAAVGITSGKFDDFRMTDRMYFNDDYRRKMDGTVFEEIKQVFGRALEKYYPEKMSLIRSY